ncbi:hypothetical protein B6V00_01895 [ANME-1 cluster archaeon ex4572_4]|nr:MAG: hypothetical protein B6V00_01895 [ANME-1 cluster archaeon ex4572_4]
MIEEEIGNELRRAGGGATLATAESCTGGLVSHRLTNAPGANEAKEKVLGVAGETLREKGAVSAECAVEMARGVRGLFESDFGVATTGIAGPSGGTPEKPVGLVFIAVATRDFADYEKHFFHGDRETNKREAAEAALGMLKKNILKIKTGTKGLVAQKGRAAGF